MSVVSLLDVDIQDNPASFQKPFKFDITFECLEPLSKDLEWKLVYVGSATSSEYDQELDSLLVGPIPVGVNKFTFTADPPNPSKIPSSELVGVTVILLTGAYDGREFIRVGYYVSNEYDTPEMVAEPPKNPVIERLVKNILTEKPRVTRFAIKWDSEESAPAEYPPEQPEADQLPADGDQYGAEEEEEEEEAEVEAEGEGEAAPRDPDAMEEDTEMGGVPAAEVKDDEESAGEGSEDIEDSTDEEFEGEEEEGAEEDEAMAMDHDEPAAPGGVAQPPAQQPIAQH